MLKKADQQGRRRVETGGVVFPPAQPRAVGTALFPEGYVEDFDEPRTKLAGFFSILLRRTI
jgi:hypothetical protein